MEGGVKYSPCVLKMLKGDRILKTDVKIFKPTITKKVNKKRNTTIKKIDVKTDFKNRIYKLISTDDMDPNDFLFKIIRLIKKLLKYPKDSKEKNSKFVDKLIISLGETLYYEFQRDSKIDYNSNNSNSTESEGINENDIWNDPYTLLRTLNRKLEIVHGNDDEDYKLEISETIKNALRTVYMNMYPERENRDVNDLSAMMSNVKF